MEGEDIQPQVVDYLQSDHDYVLTYREYDETGALKVLDTAMGFSQPRGSVEIDGRPQALALSGSGGEVLVLARTLELPGEKPSSILHAADVSVASSPALLRHRLMTDCLGVDVSVAHGHAYVTCSWPGKLHVLDLRAPARLTEAAVLDLGSSEYAGDVAVYGSQVYAVVDGGFAVIDVADASRPAFVGHGGPEVGRGGHHPSLLLSRGHAFLIDGRVGAYELSDPCQPRLVALFDSPSHVAAHGVHSTWAASLVLEHLFVSYHTFSAPQGIMVLRAMTADEGD